MEPPSVGKMSMKSMVITMNTMANLECKFRRLQKSRMMRGIPRTKDSFWRKIMRYVWNVIGWTSIDVVTYLTKVCQERYARRPWPPLPITCKASAFTMFPHRHRSKKRRSQAKTHNVPDNINRLRLGERQAPCTQSDLEEP